jgi:predicted ester cyclase
MSREQMVAIVQRYLDAGNTGNLSLIDETISPNLAVHGPQQAPAPPGQGREYCRHGATRFRAAYPDLKFTIEQSVVEGDRPLGEPKVLPKAPRTGRGRLTRASASC